MPQTDSPPLIAWIGAPPPDEVAAELRALAEIQPGWFPGAVLVVVAPPADSASLGELPNGTERPPVIAATHRRPTTRQRLDWIRSGAEDLVAFSGLHRALSRRLRTIRRRKPAPARDEVEPEPAPVEVEPQQLAPVQPSEPPPEAASPTAATPTAAAPAAATPTAADLPRPTPPRTGPVPAGRAAALDSLTSYISQRNRLVPDRGALSELLALQHQRVQLSTQGLPGQDDDWVETLRIICGDAAQDLGWEVAVSVVGEHPAYRGIFDGRICCVGSDGLVLELPFASQPRLQLVIGLAMKTAQDAFLHVETCWQRRLGIDAWQTGAVLIGLSRQDRA